MRYAKLIIPGELLLLFPRFFSFTGHYWFRI